MTTKSVRTSKVQGLKFKVQEYLRQRKWADTNPTFFDNNDDSGLKIGFY